MPDFIVIENAMLNAPLLGFAQLGQIPLTSGIYSAWIGEDTCFYVGKATQLGKRISSHYSGQRGSNQFCLYVYDVYVFSVRPLGLTTSQVNNLTKTWIRENVKFRYLQINESELDLYERGIIQRWQPTLNSLSV